MSFCFCFFKVFSSSTVNTEESKAACFQEDYFTRMVAITLDFRTYSTYECSL